MLPHVFHHRIKTKGHLLTHVAFKVLFIQNHLKHIQDAIEKLKSYENQVWPLTKFISVFFFVKMVPDRGNTIIFRSSQQLPRFRLTPPRAF